MRSRENGEFDFRNRFLNIGGVMVNINQIATMKWVAENPIKGNV